jgi:hypothetical protein
VYDDKRETATLNATFFIKDGRRWTRFDEVHRERAYSNRSIRLWLKETGFQVKGIYRCFTFERPNKKTNRICVVARRPG